MSLSKTCPKCDGTNTQKASKLGYYAGSRFCKDCAIYYNQTKEEAYSKAWCLYCNEKVLNKDYYDHMDVHYKNRELTDRDANEIIDFNVSETMDYEDTQLHPEIHKSFDAMFEGDDRIEVYC